MLELKYQTTPKYEIGVDEVGRGPLFGRVYAAAVILPGNFDSTKVKDSKKYSSEKKRREAYEYIKENAIAWAVAYEDEKRVDKINIKQATFSAMHKAISAVSNQILEEEYYILVDGNDYKPYLSLQNNEYREIPTTCIINGDNKYASIAAASILAKVERDQYIEDLCDTYPKLDEYYGLRKNKGYGTKQHRDAIYTHGVTAYHRMSYNPCKDKIKIDL